MRHHRGHREQGEHGRTVRARASVEAEQAASYVETLAHALRAGGVTIRSGAGLVALRMGDRIELELEAGEEDRESIVRLALRWETPVPEERLDITPGVSKAPASAVSEAAGAASDQVTGSASGGRSSSGRSRGGASSSGVESPQAG